MNRKGFVALTGATGLAAFLAACGGSSSGGSDAGGSAAAGGGDSSAAAAVGFDPATEPDQPLAIFTWAGYDQSETDGAPWMWSQYADGEYGSKSPLKFTLLDDDTQALAKVASGFTPDIIHPCGSFIVKWQQAGLIQALDTALLPDWAGVPDALKEPGHIDGAYYHMPFDTGFTSLTYDADAIDLSATGGEESWKVLLDERYKGKMSLFRGPDEVISIGALVNRGAVDPMVLTLEEIAAAKETSLKIKANLRNYWTSQNDTINDFVNGNLLVTSTWPDGFWKIKNHPKMKGRNIKYMQPIEGRMVWVCGMVLSAQSQQPGRAMVAMASANTPQASADLTDYFQYAGAQKEGVAKLVKDKDLIKVFGIDDPSLWEAPKAWPQKPVQPYAEYIAAGTEVLDG
ncbi:MAG: ABC transporter substrate-binding protein [Actinobacteria bacterium]|nr:ABC transporter substrate-binding protein [Actinomycetota bacterium]